LRHTHASFGAGAGQALPIIGKLLGHAQASTMQRYAHLDSDPLRRASEQIGGRLAAAMGEPSESAAWWRGLSNAARGALNFDVRA
jgi:hypothetical protein